MDSGWRRVARAGRGRELMEEVGVEADTWHSLVDVASSPGFTDEALRVFLAQDLRSVDRPEAHDEEADMSIEWVDLDEAVAMVFRGEIVNVTSVCVFSRTPTRCRRRSSCADRTPCGRTSRPHSTAATPIAEPGAVTAAVAGLPASDLEDQIRRYTSTTSPSNAVRQPTP